MKNEILKEGQEITLSYKEQKVKFLDELSPDDFRNAGSFNQAEDIIDEVSEGFYRCDINKSDSVDFINKATRNLFREDSAAAEKMKNLVKLYLKMRNESFAKL